MRTRKFGYSLRAAVILLVVLPMLALFAAGSLAVLATLERQLETRLQEDVELIARTLRNPLARSLERGRQGSLRDALRSTSELGRVYGLYVYDDAGVLVARDDRLTGVGSPNLGDLDVDSSQTSAVYGSMGGRAVYSYFTPLTDSRGHSIGMLQVTRRASEMRDYLATLRSNVTLAALGLCALIILVILVGHQLAIGRPLQRLAATMGEVVGGNTGARARTAGPTEIRWLTKRFNRMLKGIDDRDRALARERVEQQRLEAELRRSERQALVGRLASGVAHELGAPISVVEGHAQRLMRGHEADTPQYRSLAGIRNAVVRMTAIVHRLLDFGRASAAAPEPVAMAELVTSAVDSARAQSPAAGDAISIRAGPADAHVLADQTRLRDAIVHLLQNAMHAAAGGAVRIGWTETVDSVSLFVENAGEAVPAADRERIFEPFFTTKHDGEGSGLGLAIVNNTVSDHRAKIVVYDSALGGAGFRIDFPREPEKRS